MALINFSGIASGIDSESLIEATSDAARKQRVEPKEKKVTELEDTTSGLDELKSKLSDLQSQLRNFATLNGGGVFKQGNSSDETVATATAENGTANGTYSITTTALAQNATTSLKKGPLVGDPDYSTTADVLDSGAVGNIVVTIGSPTAETVNVTVTPTTTISQFVTEFNNESALAEASLVNVGTTAVPRYRIVITSTETGTERGAVSINAAGTPNVYKDDTSSPATDATFSIAGIGSVTRSSNTINDVIPGVTLSLRGIGTSTVTISDDAETTASNVEEWITTYNEIVSFLAENNLVRREENGDDVKNVFAPLASTRVDDNALTALRNEIASAVYSAGSSVRILADLGISTQRDGTLAFNSETFKSAIEDEPDSVDGVLKDFADSVSTTGGTIDQFIRFNGLIDVTTNSNDEQVQRLNEQISQAEAAILKQEEAMRQRFARLESLMGKLQSQQSQLTSALAGL